MGRNQEAGQGPVQSCMQRLEIDGVIIPARRFVFPYGELGKSQNHLESFRIILTLSWWYGWHLATCDISTAFLYSTLLDHEKQPVRLLPSTLGKQGERLVLFLKRTLYGLRRAPLAWFRTMHDAFLEFGAQKTSEVTVFRFTGYLKESKKEYFMPALIYVDDPSCISWLVESLRSKFETKLTGELPARVVGSLTFLGREIVRTHYDDAILLGFPLDYFDKIEVVPLPQSELAFPRPII